MDTLERLARLIWRQRNTRGERCHLLITQQVEDIFEGYKALAELLREGYFSTIVTANTNTMLERALDESGPFPPTYQVFICGRELDEKVAIALDAQESGICIIKLPIDKVGSCASDIWKSLLGYLKENIVIVGSIDGAHDDVVQTLIAERDKSSMYYIVPAKSSPDKLLRHMQKHQKQSVNFLFYETDRMFVDFFSKLAEQLLHKDPEPGIITDGGQHHNTEGEATDQIESLPSNTEPLSAVPLPGGEVMVVAATGDQSEWEERPGIQLGPLKDFTSRPEPFEDPLINSGPLTLDSSLYEAKNVISGLPWPGGVDVLLVTVTHIELRALLANHPERVRRTVGNKTYYDLGLVGRARTVVVRANEMGPIEAHVTVDEGIRALSPRAVIMTGIAFGVRTKEQQIGDVLVSKLIHDYDFERVGTDEHDQLFSYQRGTRVPASDWLIDRFNAGNHDWPYPPEIHFGAILSGSKLVDNKVYQTALLRSAPDAIGGEMEGVGFSKAANRHMVHWLLVKGISDWADGTKEVNKAENRRLAAENAAKFVLFVIGQEDFMRRL